ncbi:hypothetical protein E1267_08405 [Nonomuraea longispora]|uniref:UvrABC system protein A n=1 Tax=Nonomuraea longispora TaxID=1848320 RepID=A0A4R4NKE1_9ACTN|nr:hypothetical protein [Nonomuraea longispora]TDC09154.1 hypothetical protein E1267_08405 [Nonomuraea longispora]
MVERPRYSAANLTVLSWDEAVRRRPGSGLTEMTYVGDEPSVGLHPTDVESMIRILVRLRGSGNTVLVVEHDLDVIRQADWLIDLGPGPGRHGRTVLFQGHVAGCAGRDTPTGRALVPG